MVVYHLGGAANCPYFAKAERLAKLLCKFPQVQVEYHIQHPDHWKEWMRQRAQCLGFENKGTHMIWTDTGRLIGSVDAFAQLVEKRYNVKLEDNFTLFNRVAEENMTAKLLELEQKEEDEKNAKVDQYLTDRQQKIELGEEILQHMFEETNKVDRAMKIIRRDWGKFACLDRLVEAHTEYWEAERARVAAIEAERAAAQAAKEAAIAAAQAKLHEASKGGDDADGDAEAGDDGDKAGSDGGDGEDGGESDGSEGSYETGSDESDEEESKSRPQSKASGATGKGDEESEDEDDDEEKEEAEPPEPVKRERRTHERRRFRMQYAAVCQSLKFEGVFDIASPFEDAFIESLVERTFRESWGELINLRSDVSHVAEEFVTVLREVSNLYEGCQLYLRRLGETATAIDEAKAELTKPDWDEEVIPDKVSQLRSDLGVIKDRFKKFVTEMQAAQAAVKKQLEYVYNFQEHGVARWILKEASS